MDFEKIRNYKLFYIFSFLFIIIVCLIRYAEPVKDGDLFWHLKYGEFHIENEVLIPDHSALTWTEVDNSNIYCTWLSDVILFGTYQTGGLNLLFFLKYVCLFFPLILLLRFIFLQKIDLNYILPLVIIVILLGNVSANHIKPEMFSLCFFSMIGYLYFSIKSDHTNKYNKIKISFFPIIFLLWTNSHGVFFFGLLLFYTIIAGELINFWRRSNHLPVFLLKLLLVSGVISLLATFINPYGIYLYEPYWAMIHEQISDFSSLDRFYSYKTIFSVFGINTIEHKIEFWGFMFFSFFVLFFIKAKTKSWDWGLLLPNVFLMIVCAKYLRSTYYWPAFWGFSVIYLIFTCDLMIYIDKSKKIIGILLKFVFIALFLYLGLRAIHDIHIKQGQYSWNGFGINHSHPVQECNFINNNFSNKRLFNTYNQGGYLTLYLNNNNKAFIDARWFPFVKTGLYENYVKFLTNSIQLNEFEQLYPFDIAMVDYINNSAINSFMISKKWKPVFYGMNSVVFVKNDEAPMKKILSYSFNRFDDINNLLTAKDVVNMAHLLGDLNTAGYVINIMQEKFSKKNGFKEIFSYSSTIQNGLIAYANKNYVEALNKLYKIGFTNDNPQINFIYRDLLIKRIESLLKDESYVKAYNLAEFVLKYNPSDNVMRYNAGILGFYIEYLNIAELKRNNWNEKLKSVNIKYLEKDEVDIINSLIQGENIPDKLSIILNNRLFIGLENMNPE